MIHVCHHYYYYILQYDAHRQARFRAAQEAWEMLGSGRSQTGNVQKGVISPIIIQQMRI
jgi:hypothetical protein